MKKLFAVALGILTAIGGFVDIGDLVANGLVGARFGFSLAWVVVVGIVGICVFAEMSGRVAAVSGRATFDLIRERLGPRVGLLNLVASMAVTLLTFAAEIGGVALALELATSVNPYLWMPVVGAAVWLVLWRVRFSVLENAFGLAGLALIVFAVALWQLGPDWSALWESASHPAVPEGETLPAYFYYAIALFGAAMTPYEVFFFSSRRGRGAVDREGPRRPCAPTCSSASPSAGCSRSPSPAWPRSCYFPQGIEVDSLGQVGLPVGDGARQAGPGLRPPRLLRRHLRRGLRDRPLGRATASRSTSAGSGASSSSRFGPRASTPSSCSARSSRSECC